MRNISKQQGKSLALLCGFSCVVFSSIGVLQNIAMYGGVFFDALSLLGWLVLACGLVDFYMALCAKNITQAKAGFASISGFFAMSYWIDVMLLGPFIRFGDNLFIDVFFLCLIIVCNFSWILPIARGFNFVFCTDNLRGIVYKDDGDCFSYQAKSHEKALNKIGVKISPPWFVFLLSPILYPAVIFYFAGLGGVYGVAQIVVAGIALPLSMLFNGALVVCVMMHGLFPYRLTKKTGKAVVFDC